MQAVRERFPKFGDILMERFAEAHETPMTPPEMTALLVSELRDEIDDEIHIIVDDYQQAIASAVPNRALDYVLANLPPLVHLVLLTRFQPAVATARLKLDDALAEVTFEDLRLDPSQVVQLFAGRSNVRLEHGQATRLVELTEGWPASLVLISRALDWTSLGSIEHALVDPRLTSDVFSYLSEEAFRREDAETVAFLLATCCLESMTIELADTVARSDHARRSLERLVAHNVFTFVDRATGTYRYHQLLRDYLQQWYANEHGADAFRRLQLHTAASVENAGDPETAIELYFAANEPARALGVVSRSGELVTDNCRFDALRSWLERLAPSASGDDPWVLFLAGQLALREGDSSRALSALTRAEHQLRARNDRWGVYHALSAIEAIWFWKGDFEQSAVYCEAALEAATTTEQRVHTLVSLGSARSYVCRWAEAERLWDEARRCAEFESPRELARLDALLGNAKYLRGDFRGALRQLDQAYPAVRSVGSASLAVSILGTIVEVQRELGLYASARSTTEAFLEECRRRGFDHLQCMAEDSLVRLDMSEGPPEAGPSAIASSVSTSRVRDDSWSFSMLLAALGLAQRRDNQLEASLASYKKAAEVGAPVTPALRLSAEAGAQLARGLLGEETQSTLALEAAEEESAQLGLAFMVNQCIFFQAILALAANDSPAVARALRRCLPSQLDLGHIDFLCQEFPQWPQLAREALLDTALAEHRGPLICALAHNPRSVPLLGSIMVSEPSFHGLVVDACQRHAPPRAVEGLWSWVKSHGGARELRAIRGALPRCGGPSPLSELTHREAQVLGLIAHGHRNPEIAKRLFLSEKTVKTHINHIFTKLGVSDRVQAVLYYRAYIEPRTKQDTTGD